MVANAGNASNSGAQLGGGLRGSALFDISEFWGLEMGGGTVHHPSARPGDRRLPSMTLNHFYSGFRYNIDVFQYIPYAQVSGVAHLPGPPPSPGEPSRARVGFMLSVGVDWRFDRSWSVGVAADLHSVSFQFGNFPNYTALGLQLGYHFRL